MTPWGTFKFKRLATGLPKSAQSFQRLITHILAGVPDIFIYMDDVLIFSRTEEQHKKTVKKIIRLLSDNGLALSLKKFALASLSWTMWAIVCPGMVFHLYPENWKLYQSFPVEQNKNIC